MSDLHLLRPLWLLALLPLLPLWVALVRQASQQRRWEDLIDPHLQDAVLTHERDAGHRPLLILLAICWLLLVIALAGPAWQQESRPVYRIEQARVLLLDLTAHMNQPAHGAMPLERARFEVMDLLGAADEGQVALIGYAAEPFLIAPLTTDAGTILEQVPVLAPDLLPVAGVGRADLALDMAAVLLQRSGAAQGDVILIAAALDRPEPALAAARRLRAAGHRLSVLAVADEPVDEPAQVGGGQPGLERLAGAGGGILVQAAFDDADTQRLLALPGERAISPSGDRIATAGHWRDEGYWLLLLVLPLGAAAFRQGWLGLLPIALLLLPPAPVQAWSWQDIWLTPEQQAFRALQGDRVLEAGERFADPRWRAAAFYRAGQYAQALDALKTQTDVESRYNRGNTLARLGRYDDAIAEYDAALLIDPGHADARHNRDLLLRLTRPSAAVSAGTGPRAGDSSPDATAPDRSDQSTAPGGDAAADDANSGSASTAVVPVDTDGSDSPVATSNAAGQRSRDQLPEGPSEGRSEGRAREGAAARPSDASDGGAARSSGPFAAESAVDPDHEAANTPMNAAPSSPEASAVAARPGAGSTAADGEPEDTASAQDPVDYALRQVPDDPSGLLRERLMLQYLRRHGQLR
jgi:Ca-activated chloride channel family protein